MQEDALSYSIFESAMRLHESLDSSQVVGEAIRLLPHLLPADAWAVYLKAEQGERLEMVRAINPLALPVGTVVELEGEASPLISAALEQKTVTTAATPKLLCVPLTAGGRLSGGVVAARTGGESPEFAPGEIRLVELVCGGLARALANAVEYAGANRQTLIDDLTRLYNVRYLYQTLENEIRRARRYGSPVSVIFIDLDGFKMVNDVYGHRAGSYTLKEVARVLLQTVREADFVARYGGDEFVIMLPETPAERGVQVAERVRAHIEEYRFSGGVGADIYLTASCGVASYPEHAIEAERLIELADAAMYEAKQRDKNAVRLAGD